MRNFKIVKDGNRRLREKSEIISFPLDDDTKSILNDMLLYLKLSQDEEYLKRHPKIRSGVGLAAPQIGINKQMIAVYYVDEKEKEHQYMLINPKIVSESVKRAYLECGEGCLSVDNPHEGYVYRAFKITVKAYDLCINKDVEYVFKGYEAIVIQHEIDHLKGVLFYDHINKLEPFKKIEAIAI